MISTATQKFIKAALKEDIADGDITTQILISKSSKTSAVILAKEPAVFCGFEIARFVFKQLDPNMTIQSIAKDGQMIQKNQKVIRLKGSTRTILTGERLVLNLISHLSAISTTTRSYVQAVKPYRVKILDTRKTTPNMRELERLAVRMGGGVNHRLNLNHMVMIKDNHRLECSKHESLAQTVQRIKSNVRKKIIVEVDDLQEFKDILRIKPDVILLDNMTPAQLKKAVQLKEKAQAKKVELEASGGITLKNIKSVAASGVDRISVGALTHSIKAIDFSLELL